MTPEQAAALREPFPADHVGKLPKITCKACSETMFKQCGQHPKEKCRDCGNYMTPRHIHLDYVGHAEVTGRLLSVDPEWNWRPATAEELATLPKPPATGMWIALTVCGVTRFGYGDAAGKNGGDAIKELIGDAIRNAAMRFGVALDLWGATFDPASTPDTAEPEDVITAEQTERMYGLWAEVGYGGPANEANRLTVTANALGIKILRDMQELSRTQADQMIARLEAKRDELRGEKGNNEQS